MQQQEEEEEGTSTMTATNPRNSTTANTTSGDDGGGRVDRKDDWYKKYPVYHPYCSTPLEMEKRKIPPLPPQSEASTGQSRLVHVTAIIRHGARTPWQGSPNCWENYTSPGSDTAVWDCNLTTILAPPSPERIEEEEDEHTASQQTEAMFLFEKRYDALVSKDDPSNAIDGITNQLRGSCQTGQLILRGYEQEIANGRHLRDAYVYMGDNDTAHDPRMRLVDASIDDGIHHPWGYKNLFYRVDDDQRTLMSGQVLLRGMYEPEIKTFFRNKRIYPVLPLHTADRSNDILDPNEAVCPRLREIADAVRATDNYRAYNESGEADTLREFQRNVLKIEPDMEAVDCLMTTMCTDRTLPDAVNDYTGEDAPVTATAVEEEGMNKKYGKNLFQRLYDFGVKSYTLLYKENDSEYARLAMAPLWYEVITTIKGVVKRNSTVCCPLRPPSKFALFSGHDTTIMPMLAALGPRLLDDGDWPPYASMVIIEIHQVNVDGAGDDKMHARESHAFRILYNGKVMTSLLDGCPDGADLCDVQVLFDRVDSFATAREINCTRTTIDEGPGVAGVYYAEWISAAGGFVAMSLLAVGSALFGSLATFLYAEARKDKKPRVKRHGRSRISQTDDFDEDDDEDVEGVVEVPSSDTNATPSTTNGGVVSNGGPSASDGTFT